MLFSTRNKQAPTQGMSAGEDLDHRGRAGEHSKPDRTSDALRSIKGTGSQKQFWFPQLAGVSYEHVCVGIGAGERQPWELRAGVE
jgi:hypothetical protein